MLISICRKYLNYFERPRSHGMAMKTWRYERIILCICDQQVSFGQIMFSSPNKIFPVCRWVNPQKSEKQVMQAKSYISDSFDYSHEFQNYGKKHMIFRNIGNLTDHSHQKWVIIMIILNE